MQALPSIVVLLGMHALPAAWTGVLCALGGGMVAVAKLRDFQASVEQGLARQRDRVEGLESDVVWNRAVTEASAEQLAASLTPGQVEDVAALLEEYMRSLDADWLAHLRRAAEETAAGSSDPAVRHAVIAGLRGLTPSHVRVLRRVEAQMKARRRPKRPPLAGPGIRAELDRPEDLRWARFTPPLNPTLIESLRVAGFVEIREWTPVPTVSEVAGRLEASLTGAAGRRDAIPTGVRLQAKAGKRQDEEFEYIWMTRLGAAALELLLAEPDAAPSGAPSTE